VSAKRPVGSSVPEQAATSRSGKRVKIAMRKHKSRHYLVKVWDDPEAALEFDRGVLHPTLAKDLYTLPSEILMAQVAKQITLGHHYQMALLDRVHDVGRLVTHMGNQASLLEAEIEKLKTEGDPEQLAAARQHVDEL
ncbi:hypothetical protein BHE74_00053406, partial [Ensete ventricosum]